MASVIFDEVYKINRQILCITTNSFLCFRAPLCDRIKNKSNPKERI